MPRTGQKENKRKASGSLNGWEIIESPEPIEDRRSVFSAPVLRPRGGNVGNQSVNSAISQSNEGHEEVQHKKEEEKKRNSVKDQNGGPPPNEELKEREISLDNFQNVSMESVPDNVDNENLLPQGQQNQGANPQPAAPNQVNRFVPQQTPRSKWSKTAQVNNAFWRGVGWSVGQVPSLVPTLVGLPAIIPVRKNASNKAKEGQQERNNQRIPGRKNMVFNPEENTGKHILADFRRVPTVWSYLTAGKAEDEEGNDIPPKVTVYARQPQVGSSRSMHYHKVGHTMLGIEYTRVSKITGKKERYNIKYGFYPSIDMAPENISYVSMMMNGAEFPGQLVDDATHAYDISKTYPATTDQIERMAKASEEYTQQGGYQIYTRNCTTFVRDMFIAGGIATDTVDRIFKEEKMRFNSVAHTGFVFANAWNQFWDTDVQRGLGNLAKEDDLSYQGWGNKRITKQEFDQYKKTKNTLALRTIKGFSPASAGENMRRMTDENGQLGSFWYIPENLKASSNDTAATVKGINFSKLSGYIVTLGDMLKTKIEAIMTEDQQNVNPGFARWLSNLDSLGYSMQGLDELANQKKRAEGKEEVLQYEKLLKPEAVKEAHKCISDEMADISMYYQTVLGSDNRLNKEVMNLLSTMQVARNELDRVYRELQKSSDKEGIAGLRTKMFSKYYTVKAGNIEVPMTPAHYESYLQIYKTPEAAVKAYARLLDLNEQGKVRGKKMSKKEKNELDLLSQKEELAKQLDQSHRHLLNKEGFTQGDVDYVFQLKVRENIGKTRATGSMYTEHASASATYIALLFDRVFGGIQDEAKRARQSEELPRVMGNGGEQDRRCSEWLNDYLLRKTRDKVKLMTGILRGMRNALPKPTADMIRTAFHQLLVNTYLLKVFPSDNIAGGELFDLGLGINYIYRGEIMDKNMTFTKLIDSMCTAVMMERELEQANNKMR